MMRAERQGLSDEDCSGALKYTCKNSLKESWLTNNHFYFIVYTIRYHIELVRLLVLCTMGKNVYTEIKCHSLLTLDDIVQVVSNEDCITEVKEVYIDFLNHCYIDTEVEVKEIYTSNHMWSLFERSFGVDMAKCSSANHHDRRDADTPLEHYGICILARIYSLLKQL